MKSSLNRTNGTVEISITFAPTLDRAEIEQMAEIVDGAMKTSDDLRLLLDLSATQTIEPTAFVSVKGAVVSFKSIDPVKRYAVVGAPAIAEASIESFGKLLPLESRTFEPHEIAEARAWAFAPV